MKVLLIFPKWTTDYGLLGHFARKASIYPPLNLCYLAAIGEKNGHEVKIIDGEAENIPNSLMKSQIISFKPDIIGITATTTFFHIAQDLAKTIKADFKDIPVIIGGPHITILKEKAFSSFFDYAFIGEADRSFPLFLDCYQNGKDISGIKGILYREKGDIRFTGEVDPVIEIDSIPVPARHLLNLKQYRIGTLKGIKNFTSIMTIRGCPFKCIFCSTKTFGNCVRKREPRLVVDEIKEVISGYDIRHFIFLDDTLTLDRKHILSICELIKKEKLNITFEGATRANLIDEEIMERLAEAGLIRIGFGLESVDPLIRKLMRKEVPLKSYIKANSLTKKYNIETLNACMIGLPGETKETIRKTLCFLRGAKDIKHVNVSIAMPYPGTELYEMAQKGDHNLKLEIDDFSRFKRYGSAVMSVGDLTPRDLIQLQNDAFISVYLAPWRLKPMFKKSGFLGVMITFMRIVKSIKRIIKNENGLFRFSKNELLNSFSDMNKEIIDEN